MLKTLYLFKWARSLALLSTVGLLASCWASFPESYLGDASPAADAGSAGLDAIGPGSEGEQGDQQALADLGARGDRGAAPDQGQGDALADLSGRCVAGAFIRCASSNKLLKCNATGDGRVEIGCGAFLCNAVAKRCNQCDPASKPACQGARLLACSPSGEQQTTNCTFGCQQGTCCTNADADSFTSCDGDCNDNDANVFPGQKSYFTSASGGSFDYDCDGKSWPEISRVATGCTFSSGSCTGAGWVGSAPSCGASGTYRDCDRVAMSSLCNAREQLRTQACR